MDRGQSRNPVRLALAWPTRLRKRTRGPPRPLLRCRSVPPCHPARQRSGAIFFEEEDYTQYRNWLIEASETQGLAVHAYVFMTNHVHLLVTPEGANSLPRAMQSLGRRYVRAINAKYRRTGTLWEGRYRAAPIDSDNYFFSRCRYIELNPVRARMVAHPRQYRWSSYRAHAECKEDALTAFHSVFRRLGRTVEARQDAYRNLFKGTLDAGFIDALRTATNGGWALGGERFKKEIARAAKRRVAPLPPGPRPASRKDARQVQLF